jgi:hypothetical protein
LTWNLEFEVSVEMEVYRWQNKEQKSVILPVFSKLAVVKSWIEVGC